MNTLVKKGGDRGLVYSAPKNIKTNKDVKIHKVHKHGKLLMPQKGPDKQSYKPSSNQGKDKSQKAAIIQEHSTVG